MLSRVTQTSLKVTTMSAEILAFYKFNLIFQTIFHGYGISSKNQISCNEVEILLRRLLTVAEMDVFSVYKINTFTGTERVFGSNSNRNSLHVKKNLLEILLL